MDAIILFSHGSLLCGAGVALEAHAARLRERNLAPLVEVGYLNYSEPLFGEVAAKCVAAGADRIIVVPYFLVPGYFVKVDLPKAVAEAQATHPGVRFVVAEAIGFDVALADALIESARDAAPPERWREDLRRAAASCRADPRCPLYDTPDCPRGQKQQEEPLADFDSPIRAPGPDALLVRVHGSPHPAANADMYRVVEIVRQRGVFPIVEVGFLECNAPTIPEAMDACVAQGAACLRAVSYFLHTGGHVAGDLPALLEEGRARHPNVAFRLGDYLGRSQRLTDILAARARAALHS